MKLLPDYRSATPSRPSREPPSLLKRAFAILSVLPSSEPIALADVADRAVLPKPTVHRILQTLIQLGQVIQDADGRYRSTGRLSVATTASADAMRAAALPRMRALHRRLDETINLGAIDGDCVRYLHVLESKRPLRLMTVPQATDPVHSTALGRALLSVMEAAERSRLVRSWSLSRRTEKTVVDRDALLALLEGAARRGYAEERDENDLGVACVAVALRETPWRGAAAISITIPTARYSPERRREIINALTEELA